MSKIKRYEPEAHSYSGAHATMEVEDEGDWVSYADHIHQIKARVAELEADRAYLIQMVIDTDTMYADDEVCPSSLRAEVEESLLDNLKALRLRKVNDE